MEMGKTIEDRFGTTTVLVSIRSDVGSEEERRASKLECLRGLLRVEAVWNWTRAAVSEARPVLGSLLLLGLWTRGGDENDPLRRLDDAAPSGLASGLAQEASRAGVSGTSEP